MRVGLDNAGVSDLLQTKSLCSWPSDKNILELHTHTNAAQNVMDSGGTETNEEWVRAGAGDGDFDLLGGKSESATAGSFDANEDIKQTRYSERVYLPFGRDNFRSGRRES